MGDKAGFNDDQLFDISSICMDDNTVAPATPPTGQMEVYIRNGSAYKKNPAGVETLLEDTKQVKVSSNDTTENYLESKLSASTGITLTTANEGANESITVEVNNAVGSSRYAVVCGKQSNVSNSWLEFYDSVGSDQTPIVIAEASEIVAISVGNSQSVSATFTIYKNAVAIDTLVLSSEIYKTKSSLSYSLTPGDRVSVKVTSGTAKDPIFSTFVKVLL